MQSEMFPCNYLVHIWHQEPIQCDTVEQVWDAIGRRQIGMGYEVSSPAGLDVSEFVPF